MLIFTLIYFALTLWLALNPSKMVDRIGAILTPILLITIIGLVIRAGFILDADPQIITSNTNEQSYFLKVWLMAI